MEISLVENVISSSCTKLEEKLNANSVDIIMNEFYEDIKKC